MPKSKPSEPNSKPFKKTSISTKPAELSSILATTNKLFDVEGQNIFNHCHKGLSPAPNFRFDLQTKFPIRKHTSMLGKDCVWKSEVCEYGQCSFHGEVETKGFQDGYAAVVLYGWRKDIYEADIKAQWRFKHETGKVQREVKTQREKLITERKVLESARAKMCLERETCDADLKRLTRIEQMYIETDRGHPFGSAKTRSKTGISKENPVAAYLEAGSISGLIMCIRIKSRIEGSEESSLTLSPTARWLSKAYETDINSALTYLVKARASHLEHVSKHGASSWDFLAELEKIHTISDFKTTEIAINRTSKEYKTGAKFKKCVKRPWKILKPRKRVSKKGEFS
jgi:hypothetical protein